MKNIMTKDKKKLMTSKDIQEEFLDMDIRKLRAFLNQNIAYIKVGKRYYYKRADLEKLLNLNDCTKSYEYEVKY